MASVATKNIVVAAVPMNGRNIPTNPTMDIIKPANIQSLSGNFDRENPQTIGGQRGREPGLNTRFGANGQFDGPMSRSFLEVFLPGLIINRGFRRNTFRMPVSAISSSTDEITIPALPRAVQVNELVKITGAGMAANNGIFNVSSAAAANATQLEVNNTNIANETSITGAFASLVGYRIPSGTTGSWTYSNVTKKATLAVSGIGTALRNAGYVENSLVSIGSNTGTDGADNNAFQDSAANDTAGLAFIHDLSDDDSVVFEGLSTELAKTIADTSTNAVDIMQTYSHRDVDEVGALSAEYDDVGYMLEETWPNGADSGNEEIYRYLLDWRPSQAVITTPLTGAVTLAYTGPGTRARVNVARADRLSVSGQYNEPLYRNFFSSRQGVARLRIADIDEFGLGVAFDQVALTINNNRQPDESIGVVGASDVTAGELQVDVNSTIRFITGKVLDRIVDNTVTKFEQLFQNEDGLIGFSIASAGLGDGATQYPQNGNLRMSVTVSSHVDNPYGGQSISVTVIENAVDRRKKLD